MTEIIDERCPVVDFVDKRGLCSGLNRSSLKGYSKRLTFRASMSGRFWLIKALNFSDELT